MFNSLGNLAELMKNAGKIKESLGKANEALGQVRVEGVAEGASGRVRVEANGRLEILSTEIDAELLATSHHEALGRLVTAATNQALMKAREEAARSLSGLTGGLPIPGFPGLGGGA